MYIRCDEFSEKAIVIKHSLITLIESKQTFLRHLSTSAIYYRTASKSIISFALHTHTELLVSYWGVPKFRNSMSVSVYLYVCAKFQADCSIRSKVIRGSQNFEIRSRDPGHAHLGVVLWCGRSRGPYSISVPNLKQISPFVQKL